MLEPIHVFWVLVAALALAASCNHGWHHARQQRHLEGRLTRATRRDDVRSLMHIDLSTDRVDGEQSPQG